MRLLISLLLVSASFAFPQHSFFTVQGHGSNSARIKAHLERVNVKENVPLSSGVTDNPHQKRETPKTLIQPTSTPATTTQRPTTTTQAPKRTTQAPITTTQAPKRTTQRPATTTQAPKRTTQAPKTTTQAPKRTTQAPKRTTQAPKRTTLAPKRSTVDQRTTQRHPAKEIPFKRQSTSIPLKQVRPRGQNTFIHSNSIPTKRVAQPQLQNPFIHNDDGSFRAIESQITGVLQPEENSISNNLFTSVMIDILPEIREFTERLDESAGKEPEEFVDAVSDLTHSFVKARAKDEGREVTDEEEHAIQLTELAFNITLGLVKDLAENDDITYTMKKLSDIVPRLANIVATSEGRELTKYEIEDIKNANEMVETLTPFFGHMANLNFGSGGGKDSLANPNADFIQDYANQNLRNLQDFTNSNAQNFRDYNNLQTKQFSTKREQEYFRNNVRRVQEFARNNRKNVESIPARLSPNAGSLGELASHSEAIIKDTTQFLAGQRQQAFGGQTQQPLSGQQVLSAQHYLAGQVRPQNLSDKRRFPNARLFF